MDRNQLIEDGGKKRQIKSIGSVRLGLRGIVVDLEEDAVNSGRNCSPRKQRNEFRLATALHRFAIVGTS